MARLLALAQIQAKCEAAISQQTGSPLRNGATRTGRGLLSLQRPRERNERTSFEVFTKQLRCNWNLTLHKGGCFIPLLLSFQLSFLLWTTLSLFLLFPSTFISASLITHIGFSVIENAFSALRFSCLSRVLRGPFRAKSRQRRYVAEWPLWVTSSRSLVYHSTGC